MMLPDSAHCHITRYLQAAFGDRLQGIMLYGSQATGEANKNSDVDLAVLLDGTASQSDLWDTAQELACQLRKDVDLVDLRSSTTVLQKEIVENGLWILQVEPFTCNLFETHVISMYQQLQEDRHDIISDIISRIKNG